MDGKLFSSRKGFELAQALSIQNKWLELYEDIGQRNIDHMSR